MKYVYLLRAGENHYKVGIATNVSKRLSSVQTGNPLQVEVVCARLVGNAGEVEQSIHQSLHERRLNGGSEWFELTAGQALDLAALINKNPEIDITEQITIKKLIETQRLNQKKLEQKVDIVIDEYTKLKLEQEKARELAKAAKAEPEQQEEPRVAKTDDDYFNEALRIIRREDKASTSLLQLYLRIGYGRAARIMRDLEHAGYISKADGSRPRIVLEDAEPIAVEIAKSHIGI